MVASDLCEAEEAVLVLLDHLVDPLLPAKASVRDAPSQSLQQLVAKQVHAVVLLYNYYHRKQHRQLKFECFVPFSKLAVVLKPTLMAHMKLMQRSNDSALDDLEKQLSVTEKAIMDACDISNSLDASKDAPKTEGWPISKVAVLLIDSTKENCYLKNGSKTQGVWSLFEKDVEVSSCISGVSEGKHKRKKIKVTRKSMGGDVDEAFLRQVAFSAVKEAAGINQSNLIIIGSDVAYSLSKEKTMAWFYMMQCNEPPKNGDVVEYPIKHAIDSLQGPLFTRSFGEWTVTPVVDHFHLLPYAGIMSDWLSREVLFNCSKDQISALGRVNVTYSKTKEEAYQAEIHDSQDGTRVEIDKITHLGSDADTINKSPMPTDKNGFSMDGLSGDTEVLSICFKDQKSELGDINISNSKKTEDPYEPDIHDDQQRSHVKSKISIGSSADTVSKSPMPTDNNGYAMDSLSRDREVLPSRFKNQRSELGGITVSNSKRTEETCEPDIHDSQDRSHVKSKICIGSSADNDTRVHVDDHQKMMTSSLKSDLDGTAGRNSKGLHVEIAGSARMPCLTESRGENAPDLNATSDSIHLDEYEKPTGGCAIVTDKSYYGDTVRLQNSVASKGKRSQIALRGLLTKRNKLNLLKCKLEDEIAVCDKRIQLILNGVDDDSGLNIESFEEDSNDICLGSLTHERTYQHIENQSSSQSIEMKRLSEAVFVNSCQELDGICSENNWILPTYRVSPSDGGFHAHVTVKGIDFECSNAGDPRSNPREARASAAAKMLAKLRSMANHLSLEP